MNIWKRWGQMPRGQRRAGSALVGFLGAMLAFTLLSRALDAFTVARVTLAAPSRGVLSHEVSLDGKTEVISEEAVRLPAGFPVRELYVREGERIEEGDTVALLDTDAIREQLELAQTQLEDARLSASADTIRADTPQVEDPVEAAQLRLERAEQDAELAAEAGANAIARAENDLRRAQSERRRLLVEGDFTDEEMDAVRREVATLGFAVEDAVRAAEKAAITADREVEDAEISLEEALRKREKTELEDTAAEQARRLQGGRSALTIGERQSAVTELQTLLEAEGRILAQRSGVVTGVRVQAGEVTSAGGAFLLSAQSGCRFVSSAGKQEASRLAVGDRAEVLLSGYSEAVAAQVLSIQVPEQPEDDYTVIAELPNTDVAPGWSGKLSVVKRAGAETTLVPLSSLYTENNPDRGYVFVLREHTTTMGEQTVVERVDVQILDRGRNMAAVQATFAHDDRIVTASSRYLSHGDRVRVEAAG